MNNNNHPSQEKQFLSDDRVKVRSINGVEVVVAATTKRPPPPPPILVVASRPRTATTTFQATSSQPPLQQHPHTSSNNSTSSSSHTTTTTALTWNHCPTKPPPNHFSPSSSKSIIQPIQMTDLCSDNEEDNDNNDNSERMNHSRTTTTNNPEPNEQPLNFFFDSFELVPLQRHGKIISYGARDSVLSQQISTYIHNMVEEEFDERIRPYHTTCHDDSKQSSYYATGMNHEGTTRIGSNFQAELLPRHNDNDEDDSSSSEAYIEAQVWDPERFNRCVSAHDALVLAGILQGSSLPRQTQCLQLLHECQYNVQMWKQHPFIRNNPTRISILKATDLDTALKEHIKDDGSYKKKNQTESIRQMAHRLGIECDTVAVEYHRRLKDEDYGFFPARKRRRQKENEDDNEEESDSDYCVVCDDGGELILCDKCDRPYHLYCHQPALPEIPEGAWFCSDCRMRSPALCDRAISPKKLITSPQAKKKKTISLDPELRNSLKSFQLEIKAPPQRPIPPVRLPTQTGIPAGTAAAIAARLRMNTGYPVSNIGGRPGSEGPYGYNPSLMMPRPQNMGYVHPSSLTRAAVAHPSNLANMQTSEAQRELHRTYLRYVGYQGQSEASARAVAAYAQQQQQQQQQHTQNEQQSLSQGHSSSDRNMLSNQFHSVPQHGSTARHAQPYTLAQQQTRQSSSQNSQSVIEKGNAVAVQNRGNTALQPQPPRESEIDDATRRFQSQVVRLVSGVAQKDISRLRQVYESSHQQTETSSKNSSDSNGNELDGKTVPAPSIGSEPHKETAPTPSVASELSKESTQVPSNGHEPHRETTPEPPEKVTDQQGAASNVVEKGADSVVVSSTREGGMSIAERKHNTTKRFNVALDCTDEGLLITLTPLGTMDNNMGICFDGYRRKKDGSIGPSELRNEIPRGSKVLAVNGRSLEGLGWNHAIDFIKASASQGRPQAIFTLQRLEKGSQEYIIYEKNRKAREEEKQKARDYEKNRKAREEEENRK